ncbi:3610_t:CDS:2 [Acaulospora morrowiae]|uniref:3610_t:CDS:1 n=1 Tax=Acaulospora morrowiae TaxID=94023 RepID=A0A9N9FF32_9GLOM|nr:3610_t:CDS:2 [Acaulospora morrowiae]
MTKLRHYIPANSYSRSSFFDIRNGKPIDPLRFHYTRRSISPYAIINLNILNFFSQYFSRKMDKMILDLNVLESDDHDSSDPSCKGFCLAYNAPNFLKLSSYTLSGKSSRGASRLRGRSGNNRDNAIFFDIFSTFLSPHSINDARRSGMIDDIRNFGTKEKLVNLLQQNRELITLFQERLGKEKETPSIQENSELSALFQELDGDTNFFRTSEVHLRISTSYFAEHKRALGYDGTCNMASYVEEYEINKHIHAILCSFCLKMLTGSIASLEPPNFCNSGNFIPFHHQGCDLLDHAKRRIDDVDVDMVNEQVKRKRIDHCKYCDVGNIYYEKIAY